MASCELVIGLILTPFVGAYLPPSTIEHLPDQEEALKRFKYPIVLGDLNADLDEARSLQIQKMADLLAGYSLIDLFRHFRQFRRFWNLKNWSQVQQVIVLRLIRIYILGPDRRHFELVDIRDMRNFSPEHFALRARLLQRPTCFHDWYLRGRRAFPLRLPPAEELTRSDAKFQTLKAL